MTTPLSKMVALLIPSPLTPKRGRGSAGSLSEVNKGVAKVCGWRLAQICASGNMGKNSVGADKWGNLDTSLVLKFQLMETYFGGASD